MALHHLERAALACPQVRLGVPGWKDRYYDAKFPGVDDAGRREVAAAYVEGLQWVMRYYYDGCASWKWFYPYHYAPFAADLAAAIDPGQPADFELARPFRPFEQLMGVLPPRSAHALPEPLAQLMTDPGSEIADFYPEDFALDLNGKKFLWQAVVLLPFIDEARDYPRLPEITRDYPRLPEITLHRRGAARRRDARLSSRDAPHPPSLLLEQARLVDAMGERLRKLSGDERRRNSVRGHAPASG